MPAVPHRGRNNPPVLPLALYRGRRVVDETGPAYPLEGSREVVAGNVRVDNIRPTEL